MAEPTATGNNGDQTSWETEAGWAYNGSVTGTKRSEPTSRDFVHLQIFSVQFVSLAKFASLCCITQLNVQSDWACDLTGKQLCDSDVLRGGQNTVYRKLSSFHHEQRVAKTQVPPLCQLYCCSVAVLTWQDIKKEISKYNSILLCSLEWKIICMLPLLMVQNHNAETTQGIQIWTFIQTPPSGFSSSLDPRLEGTYFLSSGRPAFCKASPNSERFTAENLGRRISILIATNQTCQPNWQPPNEVSTRGMHRCPVSPRVELCQQKRPAAAQV